MVALERAVVNPFCDVIINKQMDCGADTGASCDFASVAFQITHYRTPRLVYTLPSP